jgi:alpha-tubulin suppressor-like RCC1 family protein
MKQVVSALLMIAVLVGCKALPQPVDSSEPDPGLASEKGEPQDFPDLAAGAGHSCLLTTTGRIECWGANQYGQLGGKDGPFTLLENGPPFSGRIPGDWAKAKVRGLTGKAVAVSSGYYHTCALVGVGGVQCWGWNASGQLGTGTNVDSDTAVHVQGLDIPVTAIDLGVSHSCALMETGDVRCWGENENGQLGDGTRENSNSPVTVQGLTDKVVQIAAGGMFTCALTENGELYCWGNGANGRFSDDSEVNPTPVLVDGLDQNVDLIVAGDFHLCARTTSGEILCWGSLSSDREFTSRTPLVVKELTGTVVAITAGGGHTCALTVEDGVNCWGDNYFGQLGNGTDLSSWEPVDVIGATDGVLKIASGSGHVCALTMDGGVKCWGDCSFGQCGDSALQWVWSSYTNHKYYFSVDYPPGWNVMELPNPDYPAEIDQVWFASSSFPLPQTDARADVTLWITKEDPTPKWDARFFDNYISEVVWLGNVSALRISGTNKESHQDELVIIVKTGDYFIQAMPEQSPESLRYFDQVMYTLNIDWGLVTVPVVTP